MAAFVRTDPSDRAAFDEHWQRISKMPNVVNRAIEVDGALAGSLGKWERDGEAEVTYWLGREFWGRGIATEALRLLLTELYMRPVFASVAAGNIGSARVQEKCGFKPTGLGTGFAPYLGQEIEERRYRLDDLIASR